MENIKLGDNKEGLKKQEDFLEMAKEMIRIGRGDIVVDNLDKLKYLGEQDKLDLARDLAVKNSEILILNVDKFGIRDETNRLELVNICIRREPRKVLANIDKFNISSSRFGMGLAEKFIKAGNINLFIRNVEKFKLDNPKDRLELVNNIIKVPAYCGVLIDNIYKFNIEDVNDRLKILESLIEKDKYSYRLISNIDKFNIQDEQDRVMIAKKLLPNNAQFVIGNIHKFNITTAENMLDITEQVILNLSLELIPNISRNGEGLSIEYARRVAQTMFKKTCESVSIPQNLIYKLRECEERINNIEKLGEFYRKGSQMVNFSLPISKKNEYKLNAIINDIKEERRKEDARGIVENIAFIVENFKIGMARENELTRLIEELITIRNPKLKAVLLPLAASLIKDNKLDLVKKEMKNNNKKKAYPAIEAIIFDKLSLYDENNKDTLEDIRKVFSKNSFLKNSKDVQEVMISFIKLEDLKLSYQTERNVLKFLIKHPNDICKNFRYIMSIVSLEGVNGLDIINETLEADGIKNMFYKAYNRYINVEDDEKFYKEYEDFINKPENISRNLGELIIIYLSKNKEEEKLVRTIERYVRTMEDIEKFRNERYNINASKHLEALDQIDKGVYKKWVNSQKDFRKPSNTNRAYITDDPVDLLLLGTEIDGSCQNIEYGERLNKCLMGYVMDGKNKAVVIKNDEGRIIARSVIRLLINKKTNEIVMGKERMYTVNGMSRDVEKELEDRCIEYAKYLGVSLICEIDQESMYEDLRLLKRYEDAEKYNGVLISKGSVAPYEYIDMGLGYTDGEYEVENDDLVYLYNNKG